MTLFFHSIILGSILYSIITEVNFVLNIFPFPDKCNRLESSITDINTDENVIQHMIMVFQISGERNFQN